MDNNTKKNKGVSVAFNQEQEAVIIDFESNESNQENTEDEIFSEIDDETFHEATTKVYDLVIDSLIEGCAPDAIEMSLYTLWMSACFDLFDISEELEKVGQDFMADFAIKLIENILKEFGTDFAEGEDTDLSDQASILIPLQKCLEKNSAMKSKEDEMDYIDEKIQSLIQLFDDQKISITYDLRDIFLHFWLLLFAMQTNENLVVRLFTQWDEIQEYIYNHLINIMKSQFNVQID